MLASTGKQAAVLVLVPMRMRRLCSEYLRYRVEICEIRVDVLSHTIMLTYKETKTFLHVPKHICILTNTYVNMHPSFRYVRPQCSLRWTRLCGSHARVLWTSDLLLPKSDECSLRRSNCGAPLRAIPVKQRSATTSSPPYTRATSLFIPRPPLGYRRRSSQSPSS